MICTVRELVTAFDGTGKLADFLKIVPSAVSNMLAQNDIPRGYHLEIYLECERRGLRLDTEALFGLAEERPTRPKRKAEQRVA